jgi:hypoxanthine phosphoribosyltransferase
MNQSTLTQLITLQNQAECLYTESEIDTCITQMAAQIAGDIADSIPIICCVMNGGLPFYSQLLRQWDFPLQCDYLQTSRYGNETQGSELIWQALPKLSFAQRTVLIVDDILDQGETLESIVNACRTQGASRVLSAVLVEKQHARKTSTLQPNYVGFTVPDRYVFGYGMDYQGYFRNLTSIYALP